MIVCLCQGVSEKRIQTAIRKGACTRKQVTKSCRAGSGCGECHRSIRELIAAADMAEAAQRSEDSSQGIASANLAAADALASPA